MLKGVKIKIRHSRHEHKKMGTVTLGAYTILIENIYNVSQNEIVYIELSCLR